MELKGFQEREPRRFVSGHDRRSCSVCGAPLTVHETAKGDVCGRRECELTALKRRLELERRLKLELEEKVRSLRHRRLEHVLDQADDLADDLPIAVLPTNDRRLLPLPDERRTAFLTRLSTVITEALSTAPEAELENTPEAVDGSSDPELDSYLPILASGCATCRGYCCPQGREHAFLYPEAIHRYLGRRPDAEPAEIIAEYASYLDQPTYEDSCVFHAEKGCRLPRDLRSHVCNDYLCRGLQEFRSRLILRNKRQGFAAATEGQEVVRTAIVDDQGARPTSGV